MTFVLEKITLYYDSFRPLTAMGSTHTLPLTYSTVTDAQKAVYKNMNTALKIIKFI